MRTKTREKRKKAVWVEKTKDNQSTSEYFLSFQKIKGFSTVYQIPSSAFKWEAMFVGGFNPGPFNLIFSWTFFIMK